MIDKNNNPLSATDPFQCPLCTCTGRKIRIYQTRKKRRYWQCSFCYLIFVDPSSLLTREAEKHVYQYHQNSPDHSGYVEFLRKIINPSLDYLTPAMRGLDYGCGPGPTLSVLLGRENISCCDYDPIFFPDCPPGDFDFIFATECFEHFHAPAREMERLSALLKGGGYLFVMTELWGEDTDFRTWYYKNDPTHVSFYHRRSFDYICLDYGFGMLKSDDMRVLIMQKISS